MKSTDSGLDLTLQLKEYVRAGYAGVYIVSYEDDRINAAVKDVAKGLKRDLFVWQHHTGLMNATTGKQADSGAPQLDAISLLDALRTAAINDPRGEHGEIYILQDFHLHIGEDPMVLCLLKAVLALFKNTCRTLIITGCRLVMKPELEHEIVVVDSPLPDAGQLTTVVRGILTGSGKEASEEAVAAAVKAAAGMTTVEAENAFALSIVRSGHLDKDVVYREKTAVVRKSGLMEVISSGIRLEDVGGLDLLKSWILARRRVFTPEAREYGLPLPRGLLVVGVPGCGKSLVAKAVASALDCPLLKLDIGKLFGSLQGQTESQWRQAIAVAEAVAPCVVWLDEIEKSLSGSGSSDMTDGGTTSRLFGSILTWMQEHKSPVFIMATANDVSRLPAELLRKGRFDEIFSVDLPTAEERLIIWGIQLSKYGRKPTKFDLTRLVAASEGFTGSEIEVAVVEGLTRAFGDNGREPTTQDMLEAVGASTPLSKTAGERISAIRAWGKNRARPSTSLQTVEPPRLPSRRVAVDE